MVSLSKASLFASSHALDPVKSSKTPFRSQGAGSFSNGESWCPKSPFSSSKSRSNWGRAAIGMPGHQKPGCYRHPRAKVKSPISPPREPWFTCSEEVWQSWNSHWKLEIQIESPDTSACSSWITDPNLPFHWLNIGLDILGSLREQGDCGKGSQNVQTIHYYMPGMGRNELSLVTSCTHPF